MKKTLAILLALVMVMSLATTAFAASITIDNNLTEGTNKGETYKAYKIFDADISGTNFSYSIDSTSVYYQTIVDSGFFTLTQINGTTTYAVVAKDTTTEENIKTLASSLKTIADTQTADATATSDGAKSVVLDDLNPGYYLVTSSLGSALIVDTTSDVVIETKNSYPSTNKTEDKTTAAYGETVTYTVPVVIPATADGAIYLHDTMDGLSYNEGSLVAKNGNDENATTLTGVSVVERTCDKNPACTVHFEVSAATVAANLGKTIYLTYTADVKANVTIGKNTVQLEYKNYWSPEYQVTVKNYKLDVYKTDGTNGLEGAGFVVKNSDGKYYHKITEGENVGEIEWVDNVNDATQLYPTAATNYIVTFDGLANGTYTLVEQTVPGGYTQANDLTITIADADQTGDNKVTVVNKSGTELPSTGGMGTTLFYVFGSLMVVGAAILLVTKKRMSAAE